MKWSVKFLQQIIDQSETRIRGPNMSVELYASVLFKLKYYAMLTTQV